MKIYDLEQLILDKPDDMTWDEWMKFYGKKKSMKDKQKRTFWFDEKWETL